MSKPITKRAIDWNAVRYDQVFNYELAVKLLLEEIEELHNANLAVEKLDAIGDISFVAIGVFWKLGFSEQQIYDIFYVHDMSKMTLEQAHHWILCIQVIAFDILDTDIEGSYPALTLALYAVFMTCLGEIRGLGVQNIYYDVVHAICDSNDTKVFHELAPKTAPNVKANVNKGLSFVPPTAKLIELYNISYQSKGVIH